MDFDNGLQAVEELRSLVPAGMSMAQFALRWILMHPPVTTTIPSAKNPEQARQIAAAAELPPLSEEQMREAQRIYEQLIRPGVHQRW